MFTFIAIPLSIILVCVFTVLGLREQDTNTKINHLFTATFILIIVATQMLFTKF